MPLPLIVIASLVLAAKIGTFGVMWVRTRERRRRLSESDE